MVWIPAQDCPGIPDGDRGGVSAALRDSDHPIEPAMRTFSALAKQYSRLDVDDLLSCVDAEARGLEEVREASGSATGTYKQFLTQFLAGGAVKAVQSMAELRDQVVGARAGVLARYCEPKTMRFADLGGVLVSFGADCAKVFPLLPKPG